jgi:hypothetical protein
VALSIGVTLALAVGAASLALRLFAVGWKLRT